MIAIIPPINPVVTGFAGKTQSDTPALFGRFFSSLIGIMLSVATIWAFVHLLIGGISWMTSGGDKGKLETAQQQIIQSLVGLGVLFGSWAVFLVVLNFLGIGSLMPGGGINLSMPKLF